MYQSLPERVSCVRARLGPKLPTVASEPEHEIRQAGTHWDPTLAVVVVVLLLP